MKCISLSLILNIFILTHPNFFAKILVQYPRMEIKKICIKSKQRRKKIQLNFEPSGDCITSYITQDNGKAIESYEKQSYLGEWILRNVFRLEKYEPLTSKK